MSITHSLAGSLLNSPTGHASQQPHEVVCVSQSMLSHWNDLALLASPKTSLVSCRTTPPPVASAHALHTPLLVFTRVSAPVFFTEHQQQYIRTINDEIHRN
jgi:hypothetical protein